MSKRALLVGIDRYDQLTNLNGCVNDVNELAPLFERNEDRTPNFECQSLTTADARVTREALLVSLDKLLSPGAEVAVFFFAGHGALVNGDVVLVTQDGSGPDLGVNFRAVLSMINQSPVGEVVIILDCCFAGAAGGESHILKEGVVLRKGVSILTASRIDQTAAETSEGRGQFSVHLQGALEGGAADVLGQVTVAGVYAYLSESFGAWEQRPMFKANVDKLHPFRLCSPAVPLCELRRLPEFFVTADGELSLDSSFEPQAEPSHPVNEAIFAILQSCRGAKLVEPVGCKHLYFAAIENKACRLTRLGKFYWRMANAGRL